MSFVIGGIIVAWVYQLSMYITGNKKKRVMMIWTTFFFHLVTSHGKSWGERELKIFLHTACFFTLSTRNRFRKSGVEWIFYYGTFLFFQGLMFSNAFCFVQCHLFINFKFFSPQGKTPYFWRNFFFAADLCVSYLIFRVPGRVFFFTLKVTNLFLWTLK